MTSCRLGLEGVILDGAYRFMKKKQVTELNIQLGKQQQKLTWEGVKLQFCAAELNDNLRMGGSFLLVLRAMED